MLSMKWKEDRENDLVSLWQETGKRGRARRYGKRKSDRSMCGCRKHGELDWTGQHIGMRTGNKDAS
jgi:hypothetical protein